MDSPCPSYTSQVNHTHFQHTITTAPHLFPKPNSPKTTPGTTRSSALIHIHIRSTPYSVHTSRMNSFPAHFPSTSSLQGPSAILENGFSSGIHRYPQDITSLLNNWSYSSESPEFGPISQTSLGFTGTHFTKQCISTPTTEYTV